MSSLLLSRLAPRRSRSSSPPHTSGTDRSRSPSPKAAPAPPIMDPTTIARISRRKLAAAANEGSTRDSLELRRVVLIQGAMHAASAAASRSPSPPRVPVNAQPPPQIVVSPPYQLPAFGLEELQAEERWFDAVLEELDPDWDEEDEVVSMVSVHTVQESDATSDGAVSESGSDGLPSLEEFFYPPPPPYSYAPAPAEQTSFDAYPPPLPDSFAADAWDDYDDGSEKVSLATLFSDVDFGAAVSAAASGASLKSEHVDYAPSPVMPVVFPPGYGMYPPISPYEFAWPGSRYDAVVY
ncbi:hypothetical protein CALVIDRAFT_527867 [Calocera viscosa TUFC12733]|uniref:Uncharacterized protein n=1 Tax=Calocera viscosa (strain TUFC12733) TaxID=1330018 RepID=A0A167LIV7_CALVF|nr:hypothetical protein CALVIDRAFT_527867 [Calocera viscosa TUFC12733]